MRLLVIFLSFIFAGVSAAAAAEQSPKSEPAIWRLKSGPAQNVLIELYTSEGCSSCPPADAWLNSLISLDSLWKPFVPVAFHVDYWNHLGWKDPWTLAEATQRQNVYAKRWRSGSIYTPAVVVNGAEWTGWSRGETTPYVPTPKETGVLQVEKTGTDEFSVAFFPGKDNAAKRMVAHAALLGFGQSSRVKDGENRGKTLKHEFNALAYQSKNMEKLRDKFRARLTLKYKGAPPKKTGLAVWVSADDDPAPAQVIGGTLS